MQSWNLLLYIYLVKHITWCT